LPGQQRRGRGCAVRPQHPAPDPPAHAELHRAGRRDPRARHRHRTTRRTGERGPVELLRLRRPELLPRPDEGRVSAAMTHLHTVRLSAPAVYTATGTDPAALWEALVAGKDTSSPCEHLAGPWPPLDNVFLVDDPDAATLGVHRRVLRTSEKQARMALYGARLALAGPAADGPVGGPDWGLYLGLPTVDEELLRLDALQRLHKIAGQPGEVAALYGREVPPFSGLSHLNSTAAAHISAAFGLMGAMAAYSPFSDAGLQALIDGVLSVAEGENEAAVIGAVSPKVHPLLFAQYENLGSNGAAPGEGSAFLLARRTRAA